MKKSFMMMMLSFFISSSLWAGDKNTDCYRSVTEALKKSPQFNFVLPDAWKANVVVDIKCINRGHAFGALPPGIKKGDTVYSRNIDADVEVTVRPLINGIPLGGTEERVKVQGSAGYKYDIENSDFFDVDVFNYEKANLR